MLFAHLISASLLFKLNCIYDDKEKFNQTVAIDDKHYKHVMKDGKEVEIFVLGGWIHNYLSVGIDDHTTQKKLNWGFFKSHLKGTMTATSEDGKDHVVCHQIENGKKDK